jgi:para-nitrobenzyl esterase
VKTRLEKLFFLFFLIFGSAHAHELKQDLIVQTDSGPVAGMRQSQLATWLGIPYAAPPVADLRWRAPQKPAPWSAPRPSTQYGSVCAQNADLGVFAKAGGSEDCLTLNVFVSEGGVSSSRSLPVFVWIHGGAIRVGAARDHDPVKLTLDGGGVVVTLNYRLGLFGFFGHPALQRKAEAGVNFGILDQQLALDWVQRNIKNFGGDPTNVTIAGESSGGDSVIAHLVSPASAGKFQHAISMSGNAIALKYPNFGAPKPLSWAARVSQDFAKEVGCVQADVAGCLRALPMKAVLAHQSTYTAQQVIVDGAVIPMAPGEALRNGLINPVSTFVNGSNLDEGAFFSGYLENGSNTPMNEQEYAKLSEVFFGLHAAKVREIYPTRLYPTPSDAFGAAATDMLFACTARAVNSRLSSHTPTYAYEFADRTAPSYLKPTTFALGAAHTSELAYLFPGFHGGDGLKLSLNPLQSKLSDEMVKFWTNSSMRKQQERIWPRYVASKENVMRFVLPYGRMVEHSFSEMHHCNFWDALDVY